MSFEEYLYRMKAYSLSQIDKERDIHLLAWQTVQAGATKEKGGKQVSAYKNFKAFFDYESRINEIHKPVKSTLNKQQKRMTELAKQANK